jgi:hypothetical protein
VRDNPQYKDVKKECAMKKFSVVQWVLILAPIAWAQDNIATGAQASDNPFDIPWLVAKLLIVAIPIFAGAFGWLWVKLQRYKTFVIEVLDTLAIATEEIKKRHPDKNWDDVLDKLVDSLNASAHKFFGVPYQGDSK